jgi:hypothetical protein
MRARASRRGLVALVPPHHTAQSYRLALAGVALPYRGALARAAWASVGLASTCVAWPAAMGVLPRVALVACPRYMRPGPRPLWPAPGTAMAARLALARLAPR